MQAPIARAPGDPPAATFWQKLLYRWFVQYNPLYLLSAALVLGGCFLWSRGLVHEESLAGPLGIACVAEVYAASLLAGSALLSRIRQRRPAVMLAMLFLFYQWDTTLHTETCAYLGRAGALATALWFVFFVAKLRAVEWALQIHLERRLVAAAIVAAAGLAIGPRVVSDLGGRGAGAAVAAWAFALGALYDRGGGIASRTSLDEWGSKVLARATRAAWLLSGVLVSLHVLMWWRDHSLWLSPVALVAPLLATRRVRSEGTTWGIVLGTLAAAAVEPGAFASTALIAGAALCLRALAPAFAGSPDGGCGRAVAVDDPYRAGAGDEGAASPRAPLPLLPAIVGPAERARAFAGALFAAHLGVWTLGWSHGAWPTHVALLDVGLTLAVAAFVWRVRVWSAIAPLAACYAHFLVQAHLVPKPRSSAEWGATIIAAGFLLLGGSLGVSYRLRGYSADPLDRASG